MINRKISTVLKRIALAVTLAASSSLASAAIIHVAVDSSNFGVATGYLDMQLSTNAGPLTTALVSNMGGFDPNASSMPWAWRKLRTATCSATTPSAMCSTR